MTRGQLREDWTGESFHPKGTAWMVSEGKEKMEKIEADLFSETNAAGLV